MDSQPQQEPFGAALEIISPAEQRLPMVFASPHSGRLYPSSFLEQSVLDPQTLRRSEDSYVDELFSSAPSHGAPLLRALFPRAYLDVNREPFELDPAMFTERLPAYVNSESPRVLAGLGTIARLVANGAEIYRHKLSFAEAEQRVERLYRPYHAALSQMVEQTRARFGYCILVDCHSMPSAGPSSPSSVETGSADGRVDFVLGDCFGSSCAPLVTRCADSVLRHLGYRSVRNTPYAGGFTTRHYGKPANGIHALQIEINRRLYMDETTHIRGPGFTDLQDSLSHLIAALAALPARDLMP